MSRMSDLYLEISELVGDALSTPGIMYDNDVLEYVNERCSVQVSWAQVEPIMDQLFGEQFWQDGIVLQ